MTVHIVRIPETEVVTPDADAGLGALRTERGNLPLETVDAQVRITGLVSRTVLTQGYRNPFDVALEATYIFPLPDRAAVTAMTMTADGRTVQAELQEREQARQAYDQAISEGKRASIAEEERPDVFTMRVGNILPGERVSVALTLVGPMPYEDGEATYRLPLVVAPRYIPGTPIDGPQVGDGYEVDTHAVPDASRITPPVLLPGFPNPVALSIGVDLDPAGLTLGAVRSSLHTVVGEGSHIQIQPGERANRDFILRLEYADPQEARHALTLTPDAEGGEGTFRLTVLPPTSAGAVRPRDVVLLLDRSGSMQGWKMVAARRAAARIVDTLTKDDRFAVLTFDHSVESPPALPDGLVEATDRHRFRAVEHLATVDARGGTELLAPLEAALKLLTDGVRDRVLVLVTDGQVGNEDQILQAIAKNVRGVRVHTVGIDQAVNAGFLGRLAAAGGGRCELVESEDRLDDAMDRIHRRIGAPLVTGLTLNADGLDLIADTVTPARLPDLFTGAPLVVTGRYRTNPADNAGLTLVGQSRDAGEWSLRSAAVPVEDSSLTAVWARAHLRDLEDRYVSQDQWGERDQALEQRIVATSLRFGVLCRFTAWLAVDTRVVTDGSGPHRVIQPVEPAAGWDMLDAAVPMSLMASAAPAAPAAMAPMGFAAPRRAGGSRLRGGVGPSAKQKKAMAAKELEVEQFAAERRASETAAARTQMTDELSRLRAAEAGAEYERRELLADLGSRLDALVRHLDSVGVVVSDLLRSLVSKLSGDRPLTMSTAELDGAWADAVRVLEEFVTDSAATKGRREFWKRVR
jgi:Ca-activated chloride channel homolog